MIADKPVRYEIIRGLISQQDRGPQSTGIITANTEEKNFGHILRVADRAGSVFKGMRKTDHDIFCDDNMAVGHNRYATSGNNLTRDAQPLYNREPGFAIAHNGQIANYVDLMERLSVGREVSYATNCDAEILLDALTLNLRKISPVDSCSGEKYFQKILVPALRATMDPESQYGVIGAYSVVMLIPRKGIVAFKDPHGIRPLCFTQREGEGKFYAFASETTAFSKMKGFKKFRELEPGEAVFIDTDLNVHSEKILSLEPKICPFEAVYFSKVNSVYRGRSIKRMRGKLGFILAEKYKDMKDRIDLVTSVPKSPIAVAEGMATAWNKGKNYGAIISDPDDEEVRIFLKSTEQERIDSVAEKFIFVDDLIEGKRIGVVDDSIVRGTQSKGVVQELFERGAKEVHFFSSFPPYTHICPCGIDVASKEEPLMHNKTVEEARKHIGATTLNYLSLDEMLQGVRLTRETACLGCTTGVYPFDIADYENFQEIREEHRQSRKTEQVH